MELSKDEIIRMAREAGIKESDVVVFRHFPFEFYQLERFAALVAAHAKQEYIDSVYEQHRETMFSNKDLGMLVDAVKAEREACAKVCEDIGGGMSHPYVAQNCAAVIRARGK